jgi:lipopolysaccharide/colanic/teichoic acid biosynthesis glycosyltransferase
LHMERKRYIPLVRNVKIRTVLGFVLLLLSTAAAVRCIPDGRPALIVPVAAAAWLLSVLFTDKYVHKYPQRYDTYLIASHLKASVVMAFFLWLPWLVFGQIRAQAGPLWLGYAFFVLADALVSVPRRRDNSAYQPWEASTVPGPKGADEDRASGPVAETEALPAAEQQAMIEQIRSSLDKPMAGFLEGNLPDLREGKGGMLVLDDAGPAPDQPVPSPVRLLVGRMRINNVRRLNIFMAYCTERISMGGYFVIRYMPFENLQKKLKDRYSGPLYWLVFTLHFLWYRALPKIPWLDKVYFAPKLSWLDDVHLALVKKRNRPLSKAEVWGRLSFWGMRVLTESTGDGELYIVAQRVSPPVQNKVPSYYLVAALEKVGLGGKLIRTHKVRTMYPFSEFLQARIFEDHGLASTGKFANDFRLTDYGIILRKYWLDELPQIFDWLQGDIKLVGMRATSRHFLSLYPKTLYDLYIQIKPGLIPPIFDENTNGFDQIVEVELTYLKRYWEKPIRTDIRYFFLTFRDIVFRGVRSK